MNLSQIINLVIRIVMRRAINFGIGKGVAMVARKGGRDPAAGKARGSDARDLAKRARQAAKITRRLGR